MLESQGKALEFFNQVAEVDEQYPELEGAITAAKEGILQKEETELLGRAEGEKDAIKLDQIYSRLRELRPDNTRYERLGTRYAEQALNLRAEQAKAAAKAQRRANAQLEVLGWNWSSGSSYVTVEGRVKNISGSTTVECPGSRFLHDLVWRVHRQWFGLDRVQPYPRRADLSVHRHGSTQPSHEQGVSRVQCSRPRKTQPHFGMSGGRLSTINPARNRGLSAPNAETKRPVETELTEGAALRLRPAPHPVGQLRRYPASEWSSLVSLPLRQRYT